MTASEPGNEGILGEGKVQGGWTGDFSYSAESVKRILENLPSSKTGYGNLKPGECTYV